MVKALRDAVFVEAAPKAPLAAPIFSPVVWQAIKCAQSFLHDAQTRIHSSDLVLFYWDLGRLLNESGANEAACEATSKALKNAFDANLEGLKQNGFDPAIRFSVEDLAAARRLADVFPRDYAARLAATVAIVSGNPWAHVREITALPDPYERIYYAEMSRIGRWKLQTLRNHIKMRRFQTYTVVRQGDERLRNALVQLAKGDRSEWVYRDLLRFDFLQGDEQFKDMKEPEFEKFMLENVEKIAAEFGDGFVFVENQAVRYYEDENGKRAVIRLDILGQVNDGVSHFPLVVELKKGTFNETVLEQCRLYRNVLRGHDSSGRKINPGGYLPPNEDKVVVMALVTKFDREMEKIMEVGLRHDGRRSSVFVALYTYAPPPDEILQKAIGAQIKSSALRSERDAKIIASARANQSGPSFESDANMALLFASVMGEESIAAANQSAKKADLPF